MLALLSSCSRLVGSGADEELEEDARDGAETASVTSLGRLGVPSQAVVPLMLLAAMLLAGLVYRVGVTQGQKSAVDPDYALHQDGVKPLLP